MAYRIGTVKKNLKPFKAWLHYGDSAHPPMYTASFHGNQYDLNVLIRQAEAEGEPLRVQKESGGRRATKRKRSYTTRSKPGRAKKRRTLTRLRRARAVKSRGYGVMRPGRVSSYARKETAAAARQDLKEMNARVDAHHYASQIQNSPKFTDSDRMDAWALCKAVGEGHLGALDRLRALRKSR